MSITIGIGKNLKVTPTPTPSANEPEVDTYISGLATALSAAQITRLNNFVYCLKNGLGISALSDFFDILYIFAGETKESSLRNLISRSFDATEGVAPTWTQYEGFTGNGINQYLNTNFGDADGIRFNHPGYDCMLGSYVRSGSYGSKVVIGTRSNTNVYHSYYNMALNQMQYFPSSSAGVVLLNGANTSYPRMMSAGRDGLASQIVLMRNKTVVQSQAGTRAYDSAQQYDYFLFAANNKGAGGVLFWDGQISFSFFSKYISAAQHNIIWGCFLAYMNANGKDT